MGDRTIELVGSAVVEDMDNRLRAVIQVSTFKSSGFFSTSKSGNKSDVIGIIYRPKAKGFCET